MYTYRKGVVVGMALLALAVGPLTVRAVSIEELQAQIQALLGQMSMLQTMPQSSATQSGFGTSPALKSCSAPGRNLGRGSQGDDVRALQIYLQDQGYLSATPTGYFGPMTSGAVARWQTAEGISSVGSFGPISRERMKARCGTEPGTSSVDFSVSTSQGLAPLTVTFGTMLSGFRMNTTYFVIDFGDGTSERAADCYAPADACITAGQNTHTYTANGTYTATLNKITDPCAGNLACRAAIQTEVIAKAQIIVGSTATCKPINYMAPRCTDGSAPQAQHSENGCIIGYECPVANFVPSVSCKAWNDGCNECGRSSPGAASVCTQRACFAAGKGYCSMYFDSPATVGNRPPVISGMSGPTTLSINQAGTWSVTASDPENGALGYQITWGDEQAYGATSNLSLTIRSAQQNSTFTHSYATAGTYTVTITVIDSSGQKATASATVQVVGGATACTLQYDPVCGRPAGCMNTCPPGMYCAMMCQMHPAQTYGNTCQMNAAGAELLYRGQCAAGSM